MDSIIKGEFLQIKNIEILSSFPIRCHHVNNVEERLCAFYAKMFGFSGSILGAA